MKGIAFLFEVLLLITFIGIYSCQDPPVIHGFPYYISKSEDTPNGTVLFSFTAKHPQNIDVKIHTATAATGDIVYVNQTNGSNIVVQIITKSKLDCDGDGRGYPGSGQAKLRFRATDTTGNEINLETTLYISDVNDNAPELLKRPYSLEIPELPFNGNESYNIEATDLDSGDFGNLSIRYYMEDYKHTDVECHPAGLGIENTNIFTGDIDSEMTPTAQSESTTAEYRATFGMDNMTGKVSLKKRLDYETNSYFQFNVTARDDKGNGNTGIPADLIIRVLDVQDSPPFFTGQPYRTKINENVDLNTHVIKITARDGDTGVSNPVNYTIQPENGSCSKLFNISSDGDVRTAAEIDRDSGDVKDAGGVCVLTILVQEEDQYPDNQHGNTTATTEVTITVEDMNDNAPEFENKTYIAEVQENTPNNVPITLNGSTEVNVFDIDQGDNARLELSLVYPNGTACNDFRISPTIIQKSGSVLIRVANQNLLDFETIKNITFLIIANETLNTNSSATATVSLHIKDMNDNNPQFINSSYSFSVDENSNSGTYVGTITAKDKDSDYWGNVTYSISGGNNRFDVGKNNGTIYTYCTNCSDQLDREKVDVYYMTYTATDGGGRSNSTSLVIHINDKNDNAPEFARSTYSAYIDENDAQYNTTSVIKLEAHDDDKEGTNNSNIVYKLVTLSEGHMRDNISIDNDGKLYLNQPVDFEKLNNKSGIIEITVKASDLGEPPKASNSTVLITVQDINDNTPSFNDSTFQAAVAENSTSIPTNFTHVGMVHATDADGTLRNNKIQYFIISGAMDDFTVNPNTGEVNVQINVKLDRENIPRYNITIAAIDQGSPPRSGSTTLFIDILDVNDAWPVFNMSAYRAHVLENQTELVGTTVLTCSATDQDIDNDLEYSIINILATDEAGGDVNSSLVENYFEIDEFNGTVYIKTKPDREVAKTIVLTVQARDKNAYYPRPQTVRATLTITLSDINDNPPDFKELQYNVNVSENAQDPTILLTISATDRDENRTIKYEINNKEHEFNSFDLDQESGVLRKVGLLDRENSPCIILNITATDNGVPPLSSCTEVVVTVLDFNDNAPKFVNFSNNTTIEEDADLGYFVLKVTANDTDVGPNANVTFSIEEGADEKFTIDTHSGNITVSGELDRETKASYTLRIKAQDNPLKTKEQKTTFDTLTVKLNDVNDKTPQFGKMYYSAEKILENAETESPVTQIHAFDADEENTNNSKIIFSFGNNTSPPGLFRINDDSGVVYVNNSLVGKVGSYIIQLVATDLGNPTRVNQSAVLNITVLDVNLNKPNITHLPENNIIKVYECVDAGHKIYQFNYTDADFGINAHADFNISEIDDSIFDTFEMSTNGALKTKKELNALNKTSYRFQVQVTDHGTPALSSDKITITVVVVDVNDHLPSFTKNTESLNVRENQPAGEVVGEVTAVDPDKDSTACYYFKDDDTNKTFDIGRTNGSIVTKFELDYENATRYQFTVGVKDCSLALNISECENVTHTSNPNFKEFINVTVNVIDANDHPPIFKVDEISVGMRRRTEVNTTLDISLKTSDYIEDKDTDVNGRQAWVFTNAGDIQTSSSLSGKVGPLEGVMPCTSDKRRHIVCVSGNGSLINNKYYSEDLSGYFILPVNVTDEAGSDTVNVKIFLISDSQILVMTLLGGKEEVAEKKNEILAIYSQVTGYTFVYDWLEDHKTSDGRVETFKTDLYFHVVDSKTERALSASEALRVVDGNYEKLLQAMQRFSVLQIVSSLKESPEDDNSVKTIYILAAVIAVLAVTVAIIIYVSITTRNKYKRKLKAATVKPLDIHKATEKDNTFIPGSNMYSRQANPLLHADIPEKIVYDNISMGSNNSLDSNSVGTPRMESDYDQVEEKEVSMDMFLEDQNCALKMESPLDAALKLYDLHNIHNKQESISTEGIVSPHDMNALAFENTAYVDQFESTEI